MDQVLQVALVTPLPELTDEPAQTLPPVSPTAEGPVTHQ